MLRTIFLAQFRDSQNAVRLRVWLVAGLAAIAAGGAALRPTSPPEAVEALAWSLFVVAVVAGGVLTGWRAAQFPKSRAAEFQLVLPVSDAAVLAGEMLPGMFRTALVVLAAAPLIAAAWGAGWLGAAEAAALFAIPLAAGCLSGALLAVVAYEPPWVRRAIERLVLAAILAYLVLFGLAGAWFLPWALDVWSSLTAQSPLAAVDAESVMRYFNPFRLLGGLGQASDAGLAGRVAGVFAALLAATALCCWRLTVRLRPHYLEENYGLPRRRGRYEPGIGDHPLSWWTARRVSRFKGNVNLYLAWAVSGLYCGWIFLADDWPTWLGGHLLRRIETYGGAAQLAAAAVQLAVVGAAFLDGLWDSNVQQRLGRMELLLTTPLTGRQYLRASAVAGWTRGRGYLLAALAVWIASAAAGHIAWGTCCLLCLVSANYALLIFAVAFRNFGHFRGERPAAAWGLTLSLLPPLLTWTLFSLDLRNAAAATPLGTVFLLTLSPENRAAFTSWDGVSLTALLVAAQAACLAASIVVLARAAGQFDARIRASFERQLTTPPRGEKRPPRRGASIWARTQGRGSVQ